MAGEDEKRGRVGLGRQTASSKRRQWIFSVYRGGQLGPGRCVACVPTLAPLARRRADLSPLKIGGCAAEGACVPACHAHISWTSGNRRLRAYPAPPTRSKAGRSGKPCPAPFHLDYAHSIMVTALEYDFTVLRHRKNLTDVLAAPRG